MTFDDFGYQMCSGFGFIERCIIYWPSWMTSQCWKHNQKIMWLPVWSQLLLGYNTSDKDSVIQFHTNTWKCELCCHVMY